MIANKMINARSASITQINHLHMIGVSIRTKC